MRPYRFELATPADDAALRRVLAETPTDGRIAVSFCREPSYFAGARIDGRFRQVLVARDEASGGIAAMGARSVMPRYVNGGVRAVGYLSELRVLPAHRNRGLLARGYRYLKQLHEDARAAIYLTTIAEGNAAALEVLISRRAALPEYAPLGRYCTAAISLRSALFRGRWSARSARRPDAGQIMVRSARAQDAAMIAAFLRREGPRRQFFPDYQPEDFFGPAEMFRGLMPEHLLLAFRGKGEAPLAGVLGAWDQRAFRQQVIAGYRGVLRYGRLGLNALAAIRRRGRLPAVGEQVRCLFAAVPVAEDAEIFRRLLDSAIALNRGKAEYLLVGLAEGDPLLPGVLARCDRCYWTRLFGVAWEDGAALLRQLDGRPPYLELGVL